MTHCHRQTENLEEGEGREGGREEEEGGEDGGEDGGRERILKERE